MQNEHPATVHQGLPVETAGKNCREGRVIFYAERITTLLWTGLHETFAESGDGSERELLRIGKKLAALARERPLVRPNRGSIYDSRLLKTLEEIA